MTSLYEQTIPNFIIWFTNAKTILSKGEAWAKEKGVSDADFVNLSLIDDMKPLSFQISTMSRHARFTGIKLYPGTADVTLKEEDKTPADLHERIDKTIEWLKALPKTGEPPADQAFIETFPFGNFKFTTATYIQRFTTPNVWFHFTTFYDILRAKGVQIGKADFLAGVLVPE